LKFLTYITTIMVNHTGKKIAILGSGYGLTELFPVLDSFSDVKTYFMKPRISSIHKDLTLPNFTEFKSFDSILSDHEIRLVFLALPPAQHLNYFEELSRNGKSVYLEKPVGLNQAEAQKISQISSESNKNLYIGFQFRFDPGLEFFVQQTDEIRKSNPNFKVAVVWEIAEIGNSKKSWKLEIDSGGGVFRDHLCHMIDYIRNSLEFGDDNHISNMLQLKSDPSKLLNQVVLESDRLSISICRGSFEKSSWSVTISNGGDIRKISSFYPFTLDSYKFEFGELGCTTEVEHDWNLKKLTLRKTSRFIESRKIALQHYADKVFENEETGLPESERLLLPSIADAVYTQKISDKLISVKSSNF